MLNRRTVLGAGLLLAMGGLQRALALSPQEGGGALPLLPDPAGILDLPRGWRYTVVSRAGQTMADGLTTPDDFDGMACFALGKNLSLLLRNHEIDEGEPGKGPEGRYRGPVYDPGMMGGVSRLIIDHHNGRVVDSRQVLLGTLTNCAGGPTPWGTWLSCEETVLRKGEHGAERDHGYVFEVPQRHLASAVPLTAMGRFRHEAAAVDPQTGIVYLTEDRPDGLLYRFLPNSKGRLHKGGQLQALVCDGVPTELDKPHRVRWIDLDHPDSPDDDLRQRGAKAGAHTFSRGEGIWWSPDGLFFTATTGGPNQLGQIFRLDPSTQTLTLFVQPQNADQMCMGDNLTVAPWGGLLVCEDRSEGVNRIQYISTTGQIRPFGRNATRENSEFAGVCCTPDGKAVFVNLQNPGMTFLIQPTA